MAPSLGSPRRVAALLIVFVAVLVGSDLVLHYQPGVHEGAPDPWWNVLFYPALPAYMMLGGIHSDAPEWVLNLAASLNEAVVVALLLWIVLELVVRLRRSTGGHSA